MEPATRSGPRPDRKAAAAMIACTSIAGVAVLVEMTITDDPGPPSVAMWWVVYGLFVGTLLVVVGLVPRPRSMPTHALLAVLIGLAVITFFLFPVQGWTAILFVVTAAAVASVGAPGVVAAVIALQSMAVGVGIVMGGWAITDAVLGVIAYSGFQSFGALVVQAARRQAEARNELVVAHAELRSTAALLETSSRDAERLRIARELHDIVGHQLTALTLELEVAAHQLGQSAGHDHVTRARTIAKELLSDVRKTVGEMRESRNSLESTLSALASSIPGLHVSMKVVENGRVGPDQTWAVLRCAQEVITNTLRHAGARHLDVVVDADPTGIRLRAVDDGRGTARIEPGHGLTGMRERFEALGGSLILSSRPGCGFTVVGQLPTAGPAGRPL